MTHVRVPKKGKKKRTEGNVVFYGTRSRSDAFGVHVEIRVNNVRLVETIRVLRFCPSPVTGGGGSSVKSTYVQINVIY